MCRTLPLLVAAALGSPPALSVYLNPDGTGQALVFPYYTVQGSAATAFNTYVSIVNAVPPGSTTPNVKALRVRFREGRQGKEVASFNLFLSPNDVWAAAIVPDGQGARLVTGDTSCTLPNISAATPGIAGPGLAFSNAAFSGSQADGNGEGLDRTREGYIEVLEMAQLGPPQALFATHTAARTPLGCTQLATGNPAPSIPPSGNLSGALTLINVANGQDFTIAAEALADLASRPYYRPSNDPYPSFGADEIDAVSAVWTNGHLYRSVWTRGIDAVSAVLMRQPTAEYVLDRGPAAATDLVFAYPTRPWYVTQATATAPFTAPVSGPDCAAPGGLRHERMSATPFDRDGRDPGPGASFPELPDPAQPCGAAAVVTLANVGSAPKKVLLSELRTSTLGPSLSVPTVFENGLVRLFTGSEALVSQASSVRIDLATGESTSGAHTYRGLPLVGFMARSLSNGFLQCGTALCQANYGGAYPFAYRRQVTP